MFRKLESPGFIVTERVVQGEQCFLTWNFEFRLAGRGKPVLRTIQGGSHLKFTPGGMVNYHRDYWDAAEELYEKLPVLGSLMRWLKRRARSGQVSNPGWSPTARGCAEGLLLSGCSSVWALRQAG